MNAKMTDFQAAIGVEQMKRLPFFVGRRREIASQYAKVLQGRAGIGFPRDLQERSHIFYRYIVRKKNSAPWLKNLQAAGLDAKKPVFKPLHRYLKLSDSRYPGTSLAAREACSIPIYPSLTTEETSEIGCILKESLEEKKKKTSRSYVEI